MVRVAVFLSVLALASGCEKNDEQSATSDHAVPSAARVQKSGPEAEPAKARVAADATVELRVLGMT